MNTSSKPQKNREWPRAGKDIDLAFLFLFFTASIEFVSYRLMTNLGAYTGEAALGTMARFATFSMILSGTLAAFTLFYALTKIMNSTQIDGLVWRWVIIFTSPVYLLTILWSIFVSLTSQIILASIVGTFITIAIIGLVNVMRPVPGRVRHLIILLCVTWFAALFGWIVLDFFGVSRWSRLGDAALLSYRISEGLFLLLPFHAYLVLAHDGVATGKRKLRDLHWPALVLALFVCGGLLAFFVTKLGGVGVLKETNQLLLSILYKTVGVTLAWPFAITAAFLSLFAATFTIGALLMPTRSHQPQRHHIYAGTGLGLIYMAGLQPFAVYQYATMFVGFLLLCSSFLIKYPLPVKQEEQELEKLEEVMASLDDNKPKV